MASLFNSYDFEKNRRLNMKFHLLIAFVAVMFCGSINAASDPPEGLGERISAPVMQDDGGVFALYENGFHVEYDTGSSLSWEMTSSGGSGTSMSTSWVDINNVTQTVTTLIPEAPMSIIQTAVLIGRHKNAVRILMTAYPRRPAGESAAYSGNLEPIFPFLIVEHKVAALVAA